MISLIGNVDVEFFYVDYSGNFILLCRKTIATMIVTVLKNYMCTCVVSLCGPSVLNGFKAFKCSYLASS